MPIQDDVKFAELRAQYEADIHAMQSGVKQKMVLQQRSVEDHIKHLRVGINSAMVSNLALLTLLIEKGVFTEMEHMQHLADAMRAEKESYESELTALMGVDVKLK